MNEIQQYREAVSSIKQAILHSQYRAAELITGEQLSLYFGIEGYISVHSRKGAWGAGALERISTQLSNELPGLRGFSTTSLKNMRTFFEFWNPFMCRTRHRLPRQGNPQQWPPRGRSKVAELPRPHRNPPLPPRATDSLNHSLFIIHS